jgi:hypothetical protein
MTNFGSSGGFASITAGFGLGARRAGLGGVGATGAAATGGSIDAFGGGAAGG